ncbi:MULTISPECIES: hypothetical protein [unclassified Sphingomonas]|uniref:hypothetical protein n=1 Tax=unclassified Sphingomonas TaxID=196159 RepID=UPI0006FC88BC|nr:MULTISPECIES: hypothetical protein [unclassified Sphingomonas]KQX18155.1 hypothetical protein ASD17_21010 [Sphingomonas sp. Root1294]KQY72710.1 hypothetical protein ASD39_18125 [Sphingomonas sp. Root50]KRB87664.1 hypothetical protein ASE22_23450 [Sphingomonas sp. Root720]
MIPLWLKIAGQVALLVGLIVGFKLYVASERADERREVMGEVKDAQQQATIADLTKTLATERAQNTVTEQSNAKYSADLASANSRLAAYLARLRTPSGDIGGAVMPGASDRSSQPDGADRLSVLDDDLRKCTAIAVRLGNAKDWYEQQQKVER